MNTTFVPPKVPHPGALVNKKKKTFIGLPAPLGYVAGVGRGATGFSTRSDIGPARDPIVDAPDDRHQPPKKPKRDEEDNDDEYLDESNYDEEFGYSQSLFNKDPYDKDDEEADKVYKEIDNRMDEKRKDYREAKLKRELEKYRQERPKIQQQFSDLKRDLNSVSELEWVNIPEVGDSRNKKQRSQRGDKLTPVPDSVFAHRAALASNQTYTIDPMTGLKTPFTDGTNSIIGSKSVIPGDLDLRKIGQARNTLMDLKLNQVSDSVTGQTVIDPRGYLTDLQSMIPSIGSTDIADMKKARLLLRSVRDTNKTHAPAWIASATFEEVTGKLQKARELIMEGCEMCPENEDVWLEAIRLHQTLAHVKAVAAEALKKIPHSVKLWIKTSELEKELKQKKKVIRKALEHIPNSVILWKYAVELEENHDEARILLRRAVECCPTSVELWLALAKLESNRDNARDVLNKAINKIPTDSSIWITAAKLEEAHGNKKIEKIIDRSIQSLRNVGVEINRKQWLKDAIDTEKSGSILTCRAIIKCVIEIGIDEEEREGAWIEDAENFVLQNAFECARTIHEKLIETYPNKENIWLQAAYFEKEHGTNESLINVLKQSVEHCPSEGLWLRLAKVQWLSGNVESARETLQKGFKANPNSENIWLAAVKLESENDNYDRARKLLLKAMNNACSAKVMMKSAKLEWCLNDLDAAKEFVDKGVKMYPDFPKLWMMKGQLEELKGLTNEALQTYSESVKINKYSITLWILFSRLIEEHKGVIRARSILEKARSIFKSNKKNTTELWLETIRLEQRANNKDNVTQKLSMAIKENPNEGMLLAEQIFLVGRAQRKSLCKLLLENDNVKDHQHVNFAIARVEWADGNFDRARDLFNIAVKLDPDLGDSWSYFYRFEMLNGSKETQENVMKRCVEAEPRHGSEWCRVSKEPENWKLRIEDILLCVSANLTTPV